MEWEPEVDPRIFQRGFYKCTFDKFGLKRGKGPLLFGVFKGVSTLKMRVCFTRFCKKKFQQMVKGSGGGVQPPEPTTTTPTPHIFLDWPIVTILCLKGTSWNFDPQCNFTFCLLDVFEVYFDDCNHLNDASKADWVGYSDLSTFYTQVITLIQVQC
jgi:hypothetical protein